MTKRVQHPTMRDTSLSTSLGIVTLDPKGVASVTDEMHDHLLNCGFRTCEKLSEGEIASRKEKAAEAAKGRKVITPPPARANPVVNDDSAAPMSEEDIAAAEEATIIIEPGVTAVAIDVNGVLLSNGKTVSHQQAAMAGLLGLPTAKAPEAPVPPAEQHAQPEGEDEIPQPEEKLDAPLPEEPKAEAKTDPGTPKAKAKTAKGNGKGSKASK